jgi:hypothetical protein
MMRRAVWCLVLAGALPGAVVIDRIAVVVGKHAIKRSDIQRDLRLTDFMNKQPLVLNAAEMQQSAERLIDQTFIRDEIASAGFGRPSDAEANRLLMRLVQDRFGGSVTRLREALSRYGLTEDELRAQLLWQLSVLRFIDESFRPGVQVADEDVQTYYKQHLAEVQREHPRDYGFAAVEAQIRTLLEGQRINEAFAAWLEEARKQNHILYEKGAFDE